MEAVVVVALEENVRGEYDDEEAWDGYLFPIKFELRSTSQAALVIWLYSLRDSSSKFETLALLLKLILYLLVVHSR